MKKVNLLLLIGIFLQQIAFGQEVPQTQKIVITKIAATWCPPCGGTAWDRFEKINEEYAGKAVILTAHPSRTSKLHSPEAIDFSNNLPQAFGQPLFYVNSAKYTTNTILDNAEASINNANEVSPMANTGITATIKDNALEVNAKVKFFQEGDGAYYLSLLVIEDGVIEQQASRGSEAVHKRVLRSSLMGGTFGQEIASGTISADTEYTFADTKTLETKWVAENLEVAAIIWKKVDFGYEFVNAHSENVSFSTSVNFLETAGVNMSLSPTILRENATVSINAPIALEDLTIRLFNIAGQPVQTIFSGNLNDGFYQFIIDKTHLTASGVYFLQMEAAGSVISRKLVVE